MKSQTPAMKSLFAFALLIPTGLFLAGCATMLKDPEPSVKASYNSAAPAREKKTYTIVCENAVVQRWFVSDPKAIMALGATLEKQGYEEAANPGAATHVINVEMGFGPRQPRPQIQENPDSVRYLNLAATTGSGRYTEVMTQRDDAGGSILIGPNGEQVPTGGWKKMAEDAKRMEEGGPDPAAFDTLVLRAWDVGDAKAPRVFAWELLVQRPVDYDMPSPKHVGLLLHDATARLDAGWAGTPNAAKPSFERVQPQKK
jgi:hypothetical protein